MEAKDMQKFLDDCPTSVTNSITGCATVVAAKMISDAMNRQADVHEKAIAVTMKMAGVTIDMMEKMNKGLDNIDNDNEEEWNRDD